MIDSAPDAAGSTEGEEPLPLGHRQLMIWAGQALDRGRPLYNMAHAFTIEGELDVEAFRSAYRALVEGTDALRLVMVDTDDGVPMQRFLSPRSARARGLADVEVVDLRAEPDPMAAADAWAEGRSLVSFTLTERLHDAALLLVAPGTTIWYLNQHHLICDAWSVSVLLQRQAELYRLALDGRLDEAETWPSYRAAVEAELAETDSEARTRSQAHWRAKLAEPVAPLAFYGQRPDDVGVETVRVEAEVTGERAEQLAQFLERKEVKALSPELTALRFFQTVLAAYLHRIGGDDRVVVGTPFHNRSRRAERQTAGLFMNLYPVVSDIAPDETMTSLSAKVGAEIFESMQHARHPLTPADENGAYEVVLNYLQVPNEGFGELSAVDRWVHPGAGDRAHSLRLQIRRQGEHDFRLFFDVKVALFDQPARRALVDDFLAVIDGWMADPDVAVGGLPLLSDSQTRRLVVDFNQSSGPPVPATTVIDDIEAMVQAQPEAVAVIEGEVEVTYRELDRRAEAVATALEAVIDPDPDADRFVAVLLPRGIDAVASILGVLKAGAAYLPIEPGTPPDRLAHLLADSAATAVCTDRAGAAALASLDGVEAEVEALVVADLPSGEPPVVDRDRPARARRGDLERPAYVIFTSGSTGRPKGVPIHHRGLANYVGWAGRTYTDGPKAFALYTSLAFDLTITSIFVPLTTGGSIVAYPDERDDGTPTVVDVFSDDRVEVVKATPSHLAIVSQLGLVASRLEVLIVGGEDFTTDLAGAIQALHPTTAIFNEYGPTETVVGCMIHRFDRDRDRWPSVPIGRPAANAEILLLDRYGLPVPPGVVGEIHIGGPGVAGRYLGRPELSAERFVARPPGLAPTGAAGPLLYRSGDLGRWRLGDGPPQLEFLGRADDQVKIRGHRIELGEIEAVLAAVPEIESAAVTVVSEAVGSAPVPRDELVYCRRCGLPSNFPDATFVDEICSLCRDFDTYRDKVDEYFRDLDQLSAVADEIMALRNSPERDESPYDCLVLLSGGKDSTYMLYQVVALGLRPLVFTLDNGFISPSALANCRRVCEHLGVDLEIATTEHMNEIFRDSLDRFSNVCNGCFKTIYTLSMNLARSHGLTHIVTGLARGQLFETRLSDMYNHRIFDVDQIDQFVLEARKAYHQIDDAVSEHLDVSAFVDGKIYDEITFVDFYRYADVPLDQVLGFLAANTPWVRPEDTGRSTNCLINDVGIHVHQQERGFHNYALPYSWDVRLGHKQREAALDELDDDIDVDFVNEVLVEIGYKPKPPPHQRQSTRLVAHYQAPAAVSRETIRSALDRVLPDYMVPTAFVHHQRLPLTTNGKIDRSALSSALPDGVGSAGPTEGPSADDLSAEQRATAETLSQLWAGIFGRPVGPDDNFFDLGGDSITAIQIVDRAASVGLTVTPRQLFEAQTPAATAVVATSADRDQVPVDASAAVETPPVPTELDLTPTQAGMLFHTLAEPTSGVYQGQIVHRLRGEVDPNVLERCWNDLTDRHDILRTVFRWQGVDRARQLATDQRPAIVVHDWSGATDGEARLERFLADDRAARFDLATSPATRLALIRLDSGWVLVWSFHHIALDGWSIGLALSELLAAHQAAVDGRTIDRPQPRSFAHYVDWLAGQDQEAAEAFWRAELAGLDQPTSLPGRRQPAPRPSGPLPYGALERRLDRAATERLGGYAASNRVTTSTVLQAAWGLVLSRSGGADDGTDDVVFGVTTSGRPATLPGADTMVGMLVTTLPARVPIEADRAPEAWLRQIQDRQIGVRDHEYAALVDIQRWSDLPAGTGLFDSILVVENFPDYAPDQAPDPATAAPEPVTVESRAYRVQSNYPLSIIVLPGPELTLKAVYDPDQFDHDTIAGLLDRLATAIDSLTGGSAATVADLVVVPDVDRARLQAWSEGAELESEPTLLPELLRQQAAAHPNATAVICGDRALDRGRLQRQAGALADALRTLGAGPDLVVGVLLDRSVEMVAAIVGVLEAGAAYLPLDPSYPAERLQFMLDDAGVDLVVTAGPGLGTGGDVLDTGGFGPARPVEGVDLVVRRRADQLDPFPDAGHAGGSADRRPIEARDLAYLIYTSGSTGRPNGVPVDHGNLAWSTAARSEAYRHQPGTFLLVSSFSFDSSIVGLFWTLATGGTLVLPEPDQELDVQVLARLIEGHRVTHTLALPSLYRLLLDYTEAERLGSLTTVIVAGEACPRALVTTHVASLPSTELHNEYGPTEASVWCTTHWCGDRTGPVPIGIPAPGSTVAVVDHTGQPAGIGVSGEIWIAGPGVTRGYHRRPDLTAERFLTVGGRRWFRTRDRGMVDPDGLIHFGGRTDDQVKVRGHRIELAEVEAALASHPAVAEAVASVDQVDASSSAGARLVAHVELRPGSGDEAPADLQTVVGERLPDPFVPSVVQVVEALPRLPNGKVDRSRLPAIGSDPTTTTTGSRSPRNEGERAIAAIWAELLPGVSFGIDDDFFDVGGHSLLAVSLVEELRRATGVELPLAELLSAPTIAAQAERTSPPEAGAVGPQREDRSAGRSRHVVPLLEGGSRVPIYLIPPAAGTALSFRELAAATDPDQPLYCFEPVGNDGKDEPHDTVEAMAEHYLAELRRAQPEGRYRIGGSCLGAIVAWEMAARLEQAGTPVELLVFLDPGPPHSGPTWSYTLPTERSVSQWIRSAWDIVSRGDLVTAAKSVWRRNAFDHVGRVHYRAQLRYVADRLAVSRIVWLESEELARDQPGFLDMWRVLAGDDLTPIVVPETSHTGLMTGQRDEVRRMAELFNQALRDLD